MKKIVIWQTAFLGDLILTTPLVESVKKLYPESYLSIITKPFGKEVFKNNPFLDELIIFNKKNMSNWQLIKKLKRKKYDIAISPHRSHRASYSLFLARIPKRIGFDKAGFSFLYTDTVPHRFDGTHEIVRNLNLLKVLPEYDESKIQRNPNLYLDDEEDVFYKNFHLKNKNYITVAPGSKWATKRWTVEGFAELINELINRKEVVVLIGSEEDREYADEILKKVEKKSEVVNIIGKTNLRQSFSIIKHSKILISNDSAPVHMAVAFNTPVVEIMGPTVKEFGFYPFRNGIVVETQGLSCRPCGLHGHQECPIKTHECMAKISAKEVLKAMDDLLEIQKEKILV
jgi:heptosyltransferase-2